MSLVGWLQEKNRQGGGRGIAFNPIINALTNKLAEGRVNAIDQEGEEARRMMVENAMKRRQSQPAQTTMPENFYDAPQFQGASRDIVDLIVEGSKSRNIDPLFAGAVAKHESAGTFSPTIENWGGDGGIGPFQITPGVGNKYVDALSAEELKDIKKQVEVGLMTLADAVRLGEQRFGNDPDPLRKYKDAYMVYNAGPNYLKSKTSLDELRNRADKVLGIYKGGDLK